MSTTIEQRELAAAKFKEAHDLVEGKDIHTLDAETLAKFDTLMAEGKTADDEYVRMAAIDGKAEDLRGRLEFYSGKASGGQPVPFSRAASEGEAKEQGLSLGEAFVQSEEYKELLDSGVLSADRAKFRTDPFSLKASNSLISGTAAASGDRAGIGAGLITPNYLPGILALPQRPLTVRDLFSQAQTSGDQISYAAQTAFDSGAAAVSEAATDGNPDGAKPQSSIGWTRRTANIETIATWMATTRKQLSDAGETRSLIDNQGRLMLQLEEEDQLLNGNGTSPNIRGLLATSGVQTLDLTGASSDRANLDGLRTAKRMVRTGAGRAVADAVVVHPVDSEEFDLMVDNEDRYRAGDPFGVLGATSDAPPIWRMRRVESEAIAEGTALVGAFKVGATVFEREGIVVYTSDSHSDWFVKNLIAILFEERIGLAVFFPADFVEVTLKAWADGS